MATASKPKSWVDGPFKLITSAKTTQSRDGRVTGASKMASEMTLVHNCLLRGINAIYLQCENVAARGTPKDKLDFASFAWQWGGMIHEHHQVEEETIFPEINELTGVPGLMDANVSEHQAFHDGMEGMLAYLGRLRSGEEELDGKKLKGIIDGFMPVLREHLDNEIDTLVALDEYSDRCEWETWFKTKTDQIVKNSLGSPTVRTDVFPLTMVLHDKTFEDGVWSSFPPMPWILHVALRWLVMNKRKDWWRFAPCDYYSMPQEMPFA